MTYQDDTEVACTCKDNHGSDPNCPFTIVAELEQGEKTDNG